MRQPACSTERRLYPAGSSVRSDSPAIAGDTGLVADQLRPRDDVPLSGGRMTSGIVRRGDRLLRPMGPWSPAVHEYLRHLETAGFEGSPRVLGYRGQPGGAHLYRRRRRGGPAVAARARKPAPPVCPRRSSPCAPRRTCSPSQAAPAAACFQPAVTSYRSPTRARLGAREIISHGDLGPWNTVYRDGIPVAFIDWDSAGPVYSAGRSRRRGVDLRASGAPRGSCSNRDSTLSLTCPPGCACSWTPTACNRPEGSLAHPGAQHAGRGSRPAAERR